MTVVFDEFTWFFSTSSSLFCAHSEKDGISSGLSSVFLSSSLFNIVVSTVVFVIFVRLLVTFKGISSVRAIKLSSIAFLLVTSKEISKDLSISLAELEVSGVKKKGESLEPLTL